MRSDSEPAIKIGNDVESQVSQNRREMSHVSCGEGGGVSPLVRGPCLSHGGNVACVHLGFPSVFKFCEILAELISSCHILKLGKVAV